MDRQQYQGYLASDHWKQRRLELKKLRNFRCEGCGSGTNLEVHHLSYAHLYCERDWELECLCGSCHRAAHGKGPSSWDELAKLISEL